MSKSKKEKVPMEKEAKLQLVKSAAAVICAAAVCVGMSSAADKYSNAIITEAEKTPVSSYGYVNPNAGGASAVTDNGDSFAVDNTNTAEGDSQNADTNEYDVTVATPATTDEKKAENGVPSTKAEIVEYCNKALNQAKEAKVGYTKIFVRKGGDNLPSIVSKVIAIDKTTTVAKGTDNKSDWPAAGYTWSSKLRESDVTSAELKQNGQYYEITLKLGKEVNPGKGEASSYGRVMSVLDSNDAKEMLSAVKSANFTYHDGYVYAKIDSKTGKLVKAEYSACADIQATLSVLGDLSAENICSTETFTDFKW